MSSDDNTFSKYISILRLASEFRETRLGRDKAVLQWMENLKEWLSANRNKPEYKNPYQFNLLDWVPVGEPHTSRMLCELFNYEVEVDAKDGSREKQYPILKNFVERFLCYMPDGFDIKWIKSPEISAEKDHFDILIHENGKYAILIENKIKGAKYQRNQLGRYLKKLQEEKEKYGYNDEQIFLVIIPPEAYDSYLSDVIQKSAWRCPDDCKNIRCAYKDNYLCNCDMSDWKGEDYCEKCTTDFYDRFRHRTTVITHELADWLEGLAENTKDMFGEGVESKKLLKSGIEQFADYVRGLMGIRINSIFKMERGKFIEKEICSECGSALKKFEKLTETLEDIDNLRNAVYEYRKTLCGSVMSKIYDELEKEFPQIVGDSSGFYIQVLDSLQIGCWSGREGPYWSIYCRSKDKTDKIENYAAEIFRESHVDSSKVVKEREHLYWKYSVDIEEYRKVFKAAAECKFKPN